jgi:hypothetical protein
MAVATGVAVASVFSGMAWTEGRQTIAVLLILAIVAGVAYGLVATAERLITSREDTQAPLRRIAEDRARAQRRVDDAVKARTALPSSSPRLERALADKTATDAAVVSTSAERGCVENCRKLLQAQADGAELEVYPGPETTSPAGWLTRIVRSPMLGVTSKPCQRRDRRPLLPIGWAGRRGS